MPLGWAGQKALGGTDICFLTPIWLQPFGAQEA